MIVDQSLDVELQVSVLMAGNDVPTGSLDAIEWLSSPQWEPAWTSTFVPQSDGSVVDEGSNAPVRCSYGLSSPSLS